MRTIAALRYGALLAIVLLFVIAPVEGVYDVKSGETKFECSKFECNGAYIVNNQAYMLTATDTMKFRNEYVAQWKFRRLPVSFINGVNFKLEFSCRVWDADPNDGGRPGFAYVKVVVPVPAQDRTITKQIELSNTVTGSIQPTVLTLPKNVIGKDGSLHVSLIGKGWIEVKVTSLKASLTLSSKPLQP